MHRQILFSTLIITSTHAIHSISILPFKIHPHRIASLSHPLPIHSPSSTQSIPILPFKFHPHRNASLSHALPIHSPSSTYSIPILPFKFHPHRNASPSHPSHLFSNIHTFIPPFPFFHTPSHFSQPNTQSTPDICHYWSAGATYVYRIILRACLNSAPFLLSASFSLHSASIPICYFIAIHFHPLSNPPSASVSSPSLQQTTLPLHTNTSPYPQHLLLPLPPTGSRCICLPLTPTTGIHRCISLTLRLLRHMLNYTVLQHLHYNADSAPSSCFNLYNPP